MKTLVYVKHPGCKENCYQWSNEYDADYFIKVLRKVYTDVLIRKEVAV